MACIGAEEDVLTKEELGWQQRYEGRSDYMTRCGCRASC